MSARKVFPVPGVPQNVIQCGSWLIVAASANVFAVSSIKTNVASSKVLKSRKVGTFLGGLFRGL